MYAKVDDSDYAYLNLFKWYAEKTPQNKYRTKTRLNGKFIYMHQLVMKNKNIDHINGDALDNRKENLRLATTQQNAQNSTKTIKTTTSRYKGVYFCKNTANYRAKIMKDGISIHLGCYASEEQAALKYNEAAKQLFGEFAHLNEVNIPKE